MAFIMTIVIDSIINIDIMIIFDFIFSLTPFIYFFYYFYYFQHNTIVNNIIFDSIIKIIINIMKIGTTIKIEVEKNAAGQNNELPKRKSAVEENVLMALY